MSTHNICFYGELTEIILQLSSNTHLICSSVMLFAYVVCALSTWVGSISGTCEKQKWNFNVMN